VVILEKSSIKRSVIGNHVKVGKHCKITNSIIMDYVIIEDGYSKYLCRVKLDSCVIGYASKVSHNSKLKDCEVAGKYVVPVDTESKGEQFVKPIEE
jgi:translation initiation factor eIF-2B subunit gamma